ncbi:MAG: O-antigen ligase family protein [Burkholderiales bacterium]
MPEHLRALVVILGLALCTFWMVRPLAPTLGMADQEFVHRRNMWFAITLVAFLSGSFWIYVAITGILVLARVKASKPDPNPVALCLFLVLAVPPFSAEIPFVGGIRYLFTINHIKLLSLTCLLPALLVLLQDKATPRFGRIASDYWVVGFFLLPSLLQFSADSFTNTLRGTFDRSIDILLPYFVVSRSIRSEEKLREVLGALVTASILLAPVAVFEAIQYWLLYSALPGALGIFWAMGSYLGRGTADSLRAVASTGHSIALGYTLSVGFFAYMALRRQGSGHAMRWLAVLCIFVGGIVMAKSRGPWVGAGAGLLVYALFGRTPMRDLLRLTGLGLAMGAVLLLTPFGDKVIDLLPFVGTVDSDNVDYRQRLLTIGWQVVLQSPFFGAHSYIFGQMLESLRQGQGIIDIVNSYLGIALSSGLVGLSLFVGSFASAIWVAIRNVTQRGNASTTLEQMTRGLLAATTCILVTIFTVSSITVIPFIYWCILGLLAGTQQLYPLRTARSLAASQSTATPAHRPI